jgi:hypothetical protein
MSKTDDGDALENLPEGAREAVAALGDLGDGLAKLQELNDEQFHEVVSLMETIGKDDAADALRSTRRDLLKTGATAAAGLGLGAAGVAGTTGRASAADTSVGQIGTSGSPVDITLDEIKDDGGDVVADIDDTGDVDFKRGIASPSVTTDRVGDEIRVSATDDLDSRLSELSDGDTLLIESGSYTVSSPVLDGEQDVHLIAARDAVVTKADNSGNAVLLNPGEGCRIEGGEWDGNALNGNDGAGPLTVESTSHVRVRDAYLHDGWLINVRIRLSTDVVCQGLQVGGIHNSGISPIVSLANSSADAWVVNSYLDGSDRAGGGRSDNTGISTAGSGLVGSGFVNISVTGVTREGFHIEGSARGCLFSNIAIHDCGQGFETANGFRDKGRTLEGTVIDGVAMVDIDGRAARVENLQHGRIDNIHAFGTGGNNGIILQDLVDVNIGTVSIHNPDGWGIKVADAMDGTTINRLIATDTGTVAANEYNVKVESTGDLHINSITSINSPADGVILAGSDIVVETLHTETADGHGLVQNPGSSSTLPAYVAQTVAIKNDKNGVFFNAAGHLGNVLAKDNGQDTGSAGRSGVDMRGSDGATVGRVVGVDSQGTATQEFAITLGSGADVSIESVEGFGNVNGLLDDSSDRLRLNETVELSSAPSGSNYSSDDAGVRILDTSASPTDIYEVLRDGSLDGPL